MDQVTILVQQVVNGVFIGLIFGMIALGLAIIWGVSRIINVAHGEFIIVGAYVTAILYKTFGIDPLIYIPISGLIVGVLGVLVQHFLYSRLKGNIELNSLIVSFGLSVLISASLVLLFTGDLVSNSGNLSLKSVKYFGILINIGQLVASVIAIAVFLATYLFIEKTDTGQAIKAVAQNKEVTPLMGINNKGIYLKAMFLSSFIAGVSGSLVTVLYSITPYAGGGYLGWSFAITVLAGLGNIAGILFSGILIGIARALTTSTFSGLEGSVGFFIMILVLLFRPRGLFGKVSE